MTSKRKQALKNFFELRNIRIETEYEIVGRYDYDFIYNKLNDIIDHNEDCCFDLTGGKELVLAAMGVVSAERNIPMIQFNVRSGNMIKVRYCDDIAEPEKTSMTVRESVVLNGGAVVYDETEDFSWDLNDDFKRDIDNIWKICKKNCGLWNRQSKVFENLEEYGSIDSELRVRANLMHIKEGKHDTILNRRIISDLTKHGLITDYMLDGDILKFKYKNNQVHRCISKAGNILELLVYKTAKEISAEDPSYYDDIDIGVFVDWDGVIHDDISNECDTRNEIDVILMRDHVPVFISCKNGEVRKEALYELETVADRIGGEYSKKMLLTTYISSDEKSRKYIQQRAHDMNIDIVEGIDRMTDEEFVSVLRKRAK